MSTIVWNKSINMLRLVEWDLLERDWSGINGDSRLVAWIKPPQLTYVVAPDFANRLLPEGLTLDEKKAYVEAQYLLNKNNQ